MDRHYLSIDGEIFHQLYYFGKRISSWAFFLSTPTANAPTMGLFNWFPFIRKKGYNPVLLYHTRQHHNYRTTPLWCPRYQFSYHQKCLLQTYSGRRQQNTVKGSGAIRESSQYDAIHRWSTASREGEYSSSSRGGPARTKALDKLFTSLETFETRMVADLRIRKHHFISIRKNLGSAFYWSLASRQHFTEYMRGLGWTAILCNTEADISIAQDSQPGDIVISSDSDMMAYASVQTLWRLVSHDLLLVYSMPDVLKTIEFTRNQLTALAIVSRNDYQRNIHSLGPASNYSIIKAIGHRPATALLWKTFIWSLSQPLYVGL